jgi:hypothetical protein
MPRDILDLTWTLGGPIPGPGCPLSSLDGCHIHPKVQTMRAIVLVTSRSQTSVSFDQRQAWHLRAHEYRSLETR